MNHIRSPLALLVVFPVRQEIRVINGRVIRHVSPVLPGAPALPDAHTATTDKVPAFNPSAPRAIVPLPWADRAAWERDVDAMIARFSAMAHARGAK